VLKGHVVLWLETDAGTEDVGEGRALLGESVDDGSTRRSERSLEHVAEHTEHAVEVVELGVAVLSCVGLPLDTGHHLSDEDQVDDQRRGQEGVLADVEQTDSLVTVQEDLSVVLVEGALVVSNSGHVLDDDAVVGMLTILVQDVVSSNHVVDDVRLGDLLGTELLLGAKVHSVVVAQMVVAGDGGELDTGADHEVNESGLHLGLARLEVVATDESVVLLGKLDGARNEGILGGAVDERNALKDGCDREDGGRSDLFMAGLDGLQQVVGSVVDTLEKFGEALGVGSPLYDDLVEVVGSLEVTAKALDQDWFQFKVHDSPNVLADLLNMGHGSLATFENVVGAILLVSSDEVGVVDARQRLHGAHLLADKRLQGRREDLGAVHGLREVHAADVPSANNEVVGMDHGQQVMERNVDLLASLAVDTELSGRAHNDGTIVVGATLALLGLPNEVALVGDDTSGDRGAVVAAPADQHDTGLGNLAVDLEVVDSLLGNRNILAVVVLGNVRGTVGVLRLDGVLGVLHIRRVDDKEILGNRLYIEPIRVADAVLCVWCHDGDLSSGGLVNFSCGSLNPTLPQKEKCVGRRMGCGS
jgi:hypothetical protein